MNMHVFMGGELLVIESNIDWAIPYWENRRALRRLENIYITWKFI